MQTESITTDAAAETVGEDKASVSEAFVEKQYTIVRNAISSETANVINSYCDLHLQKETFDKEYFRPDLATSSGRYCDAMGESLLLNLRPVIEQHTGFELTPTYSYMRIYRESAELHKHTDRPSCEISATLTIGYDAASLWPICVERDGQNIEVPLDRGDLMIYMGSLVPHWREEFQGTTWTQLFLHYVIAAGELTGFEFDQRSGVGTPGHSRSKVTSRNLFQRLMRLCRLPGQRAHLRRYRKLAASRPIIQPDPTRDAEFVGVYKVSDREIAKVNVLDGKFLLQTYSGMKSHGALELKSEVEGVYSSSDVDVRVEFRRGANREVTGLTLVHEGKRRQAKKIDYRMLARRGRMAGARKHSTADLRDEVR